MENLIVAYEPVWAIGTGMVATPDTAQQAARAIRDHISSKFGSQPARPCAFSTAARSPPRTPRR